MEAFVVHISDLNVCSLSRKKTALLETEGTLMENILYPV
jgi:hypothetical protein